MERYLKLISYVVVLVVFVFVFILLIQGKDVEQKKLIDLPPGFHQVMGDYENFISFSIPYMSKVSGKIEAEGVVQGGYFFEGNVQISITDPVGKDIRNTYGTATTDWMTAGPVSFKTSLDFTDLPKGPGYIKIKQDDPSGGESGKEIKQILIPIIIE